MANVKESPSPGLLREVRVIVGQGRQVWRMVPRRLKMAFWIATGLMALAGGCSTAVPLLLGNLVDQVQKGTASGLEPPAFFRLASWYLLLIGVAYLVREVLQVGRRYLVENACTRLEKSITIKLVSHLMKVDLTTLTHEKVGALQGRINRGVVGSVRFLRLAFLDFLPPFITGAFALIAALSMQPYLALVMVGVIPLSLFLTVRQMTSQKGVRLKLMRSRELMEGTVVELLGGIDYVRAAHTHRYEVERVGAAAEKRRSTEVRHHFQMSLFGFAKALNEGFFHILVLALAIFLAVHGDISFGDILTFSILFLSVMAPLNEIHRSLDEGQECSLQVADLLDMLNEPSDRSFAPAQLTEPRLEMGAPAIVVEDLRVEYATADGQRKCVLHNISMTVHHGETIGIAGRSGCGKSTWLRVLMRLTHPCNGLHLLGGVPLEQVSRETIGNLIGYVGQSPFVFSGTVTEKECVALSHR